MTQLTERKTMQLMTQLWETIAVEMVNFNLADHSDLYGHNIPTRCELIKHKTIRKIEGWPDMYYTCPACAFYNDCTYCGIIIQWSDNDGSCVESDSPFAKFRKTLKPGWAKAVAALAYQRKRRMREEIQL